ncbi:MAG TPA: CHAT domain-containing protein, partial [Ktedonobacteraceae bacterium]
MTLIRIREQTGGQNGSNATLSFADGGDYAITIHDPFSKEQEEQLEWYFEEHLDFPFLQQVKAQTAAASIDSYGETLFKQLFADPEAYATYKDALKAGPHTLHFEIVGSPGFHALHWEALKDPKRPEPLALQASMVRKNRDPQVSQAKVRTSPTLNVLLITARPFGKQDVGYRTISRPLVEGLRQIDVPVQIEILRPGTYQALVEHLEEVKQHKTDEEAGGYYHVIHFDVHGALLTHKQLQQAHEANRYLFQARYGCTDIAPYEGHKAFLFLDGEQDEQADPVEASELSNLLLTYQIPIAILNACQSGKQVGKDVDASETSLGSRLMQAGTQQVLAMGYSVTVTAAEMLMSRLYKHIFSGQDLATAICRARQELYNRKGRQASFNQTIDLEDWLLPVVYQNQAQRLRVREFSPEESKAYYEQQAQSYTPPQPNYGFVGRDLDILQLEKRLLTKRNIMLVQGMGGAGKTTLLQHLGAWWQTTGLVEQIFYFGYDEKAWTRQQILHSIAPRLLGPVDYLRVFQPLPLDAQQVLLTRRLRAQRHLLMLDNLESITGAQLAIQHTLPAEEQEALHTLLADLTGGQT